jgi:C_GCAxxG_C_C family probable redox protein
MKPPKAYSDDAGQLFLERYSCSQAVFAAFAPSLGVDLPQALRVSAALGGGLGAGSTCGAVLGALLVLGLRYCDEDCTPDNRHSVMAAVDSFNSQFGQRVGSMTCPGILGYDLRDTEQRAIVQDLGLRESTCLSAVRTAAEILEAMLAGSQHGPRADSGLGK